MRYGIFVVVLLGVIPAAHATVSISNISTSTLATGSGIKFIYGEIKNSSCNTTPCSRTQSVSVGSGYSSNTVFLTNFFLGFKDGSGGAVNRARLVLSSGNYNSGAGTLDITLDAVLQANPPPSPDVDWYFDVYMMIVVSDDVSTHVGNYLSETFSGNGASGECDTTGACFDGTTMTGAGLTGIPFKRMFISGFDVSTTTMNGLQLSDLTLSVTAYTASGNNANGSAECFLGASTTEELTCKIYEASLASVTASNLNYVNKTASTSGQTNWVTGSTTAASGTASDASGAAYGLRKISATASSAGQLYHLHGGCHPASFNALAGATGELSMTTNFGFMIPSTTYNSSLDCVAIFVP